MSRIENVAERGELRASLGLAFRIVGPSDPPDRCWARVRCGDRRDGDRRGCLRRRRQGALTCPQHASHEVAATTCQAWLRTESRVAALLKAVHRVAPRASATVDVPGLPTGSWFVDFREDARHAVVEVRPTGFGVSADSGAYGEGPERVENDAEAAAMRVAGLPGDTA